MNITIAGTLEEIDAFVLRYRPASMSVTGISPVAQTKSEVIEINGQKMKLDSAPEALPVAIKKQAGIPEPNSLSNFFIPEFIWDKKAAKSYKNLFFFDAEDGRVMLSYFSGRVFTTKEKVMQIPYPLVEGYEPLRALSPNKRSSLRMYRQYLAEQEQNSVPKYIEKSTPDRIKENSALKEKAKENAKEMSPKTKKLHDDIAMKIKMGIP